MRLFTTLALCGLLAGTQATPSIRRASGQAAAEADSAAPAGLVEVECPFFGMPEARVKARTKRAKADGGLNSKPGSGEKGSPYRKSACLDTDIAPSEVEQLVAKFPARVHMIPTGKKYPQEVPKDYAGKAVDAEVELLTHACPQENYANTDADRFCAPSKLDHLNERGFWYGPSMGPGATNLIVRIKAGSETHSYQMLVGNVKHYSEPGYCHDLSVAATGDSWVCLHAYKPAAKEEDVAVSTVLAIWPKLDGSAKHEVCKRTADVSRASKQLIGLAGFYWNVQFLSGGAAGEPVRSDPTGSITPNILTTCIYSYLTGKAWSTYDASPHILSKDAEARRKLFSVRALGCPVYGNFDNAAFPSDYLTWYELPREPKGIAFPRPAWWTELDDSYKPRKSGQDRRPTGTATFNLEALDPKKKIAYYRDPGIDIACAMAVADKGVIDGKAYDEFEYADE